MGSSSGEVVALAAVPVPVPVPVLAVAVALALAACGGEAGGDPAGGDGRLDVVASFYPLAEAATRVGGDRVDVVNLTPPGTEPHDLELTPDQVDDLEDADVVLYLGQDFQPAVAEVAGRRDGVTVDLLDALDLGAGASDGDDGPVDPHVWLDPRLMADAVGRIETALAEASAGDAAMFARGAGTYEDELRALNRDMERRLSRCERDEIVTSHAAFHYLAERYGLTQTAVAGLSPDVEPDADRIGELADQIEADGTTTVFYETLVSPDVAETLAREAGVGTAVLDPLEGLTDERIAAGDDYDSVMRDNLAALAEALGCRR